uniref:Serine/threonine-protein phosphatase PGAM5, mitochondrial n=2 Tax=Lutzomyia longipalpis TaxID=7200 RepID=A0A1B0C8W4_LUTLO
IDDFVQYPKSLGWYFFRVAFLTFRQYFRSLLQNRKYHEATLFSKDFVKSLVPIKLKFRMSAGSWSKLQKISTVLFGAVGGATAYYFYTRKQESNTVFNSWTTNFEVSPCGKWDSNWDHREPTSIVKPLKKDVDANEENKYNEKLEKATPKAIRHLILIRHGQYNQSGESDSKHYLTEIGRKQAAFTGDRLKLLQINWDKMIKSTLLRAQETGSIISTSLPQVPVENCSLLEEGAPIPPEPPIGHFLREFFSNMPSRASPTNFILSRAPPTLSRTSMISSSTTPVATNFARTHFSVSSARQRLPSCDHWKAQLSP